MCLVDLNRSTSGCHHAWYHLIEPCTTNTSLANCNDGIKVDGWEIRASFCPWCQNWATSTEEYRLVGTSVSSRHPSVSSSVSSIGEPTPLDQVWSLSQRASASTSVFDARQLSRSASITSDTGHKASPVSMTSAKNQRMNDRVDRYMNEYPPYLSEASRLASDGGKSRGKSKEEDALHDIPEVPSASSEARVKKKSIAESIHNTKADKESSWRRRSKTFSNLVRRGSAAV